MKILMVNKFLYPNGGSETYIFKIGQYLNTHGHEVQFFGMEHEGRIVGNHAECYTTNMDFHTGKLQKLLYPFKIIYSHEAKKKMRLVLEDFNPDAVHINNFNFQLTPSILYTIKKYEKKHNKRLQVIYTAHDTQWVCPNHLMRIPASGALCDACIKNGYKECIKNNCIHNSKIKSILAFLEAVLYKKLRTYRLVDIVICPSEFLKHKLSSYRLIANKCLVMHNFVDRKLNYDKENYVLYFGRYSPEKGVDTLLRVCNTLSNIPFVFAGAGELKDKVESTKNVKNLNFLQGDELAEVIAKARFSVFTSECYENCPLSVMESQMYGTPVIAANIGGTPELLQPGITGELYESGNAEELKAAIQKLWDDRELCEEYHQNCKNVSFDTLEVYCKKLLKLYAGEKERVND